MPFERTRVYYRNTFLHIGHLQTLFYNNNIAKQHNGICYAIIDDRQDPDKINDVIDDFKYLELDKVKVISVHDYNSKILDYTIGLVRAGKIHLNYCSNLETDPERIIGHLRNPQMHYRLLLHYQQKDRDPSIAYVKPDDKGCYHIVFLFDYIIKVLDSMLNITDIISTSVTDVTDVRDPSISVFFDNLCNITYHRLDTYYIQGFKYSKRDWPFMDEHDPYLLTIKGLKARHVPRIVLYAFYIHATQMGSVKIIYLNNILRNYLDRVCDRAFGITHPIKLVLDNWKDKYTEYIYRPVNPLRDSTEHRLCPLSSEIYIDQSDCGIDDSRLSKGRVCRLKYGPYVVCNSIEIDKTLVLHGELIEDTSDKKRCVQWISSANGQDPVLVCFILYQWFYTGQNTITRPVVTRGYIERAVFDDLTKIYQLERNGYYVYDKFFSAQYGIPSFMRICKIKN